MIDYIIVSESDQASLELEVNSKIKDGFLPIGGIAVSFVPNTSQPNIFFYQAMTKEVETAEPSQYEKQGITFVG